jgi:hypothetical protein
MREPINDRWQVSPRNADGTRRRLPPPGPHIGPLRLTPTRVTLFIAVVGSSLFLVYSITVRDASQIPMLSSGAGVLGLAFSALALAGVIGTFRAGRAGAGGRAMVLAIGGGIAALIAAACFASAVILALVYGQ